MPIKMPSKKAIEQFLEGAPDATRVSVDLGEKKKRVPVMRGKREQISITLTPQILEQIDATAARRGITRNALIALSISKALDDLG